MTAFRPDRARVAHEVGATVRLALPLIAAQLAAIGSNVIDAVLSGHYSTHVLGAVAVGANVWSLAIVTGIGLMMAVPPSVAQLDGARRRHEVGALFRQALWLALLTGVVLWFAVRHASPLFAWIGVTPDLRADVDAFLHAISWGAPALTCYFALRGLSEGLSLTRPSMFFSLAGLVLLVPLGYVFMFGRLGLPPQGARGCGMATALALWLELAGFAIYVLRHPNYRGLGLVDHFEWPDWRRIGELLHVGGPMAVSLLAEAGLFVAVALGISRLGDTVMASHQVAINVASLFFMVPLGLAMAITVRVGNAVGRGDAVGVRYAGFCGIGLSLVTQLVSAAVMFGLPHRIAGLYTHQREVIDLAAQLLLLAGVFQFSDGVQVASNGALRGLKDTRVPMAITLFSYWGVGMPVGWWLAFHQGLGARGMWMGLIAGLSASAILLFTRFWRSARRGRWVGARQPDQPHMTAPVQAGTLPLDP
ncbi:MATE family efflux transporter [Dyella lutea]|uniref:Multidrug-efflux transporter n=1 Tax=Dyella lutea TaxID=2950441 RepID=A0ABT1FFH8_9GAMM|nr:MATE family efflux transporter [Dyella lutea]MCP1376139.1 MATE family efflux transporter [Dyella lutea]